MSKFDALVVPLALLSLGLAQTPGLACGKPTSGAGLAGDPCTSKTVAQESDLSFSIRPADPRRARTAERSETGARRAPVALGDGLKADIAIFARQAAQGKEGSDARR